MGPEVVAAAALGGLALDGASSIVQGVGEKKSQDWLASRDARAAQLGLIKGEQTSAFMRDELNTTLSNIDVVRSAANADPMSPTALAVKEREREVGDRQRRVAVGNINAQAQEDAASAMYRREAGRTALLGGFLGAGGKIGKGIGMMKPTGKA